MKVVRCKNNEQHTISYCDIFGYYCDNCKCGQDKNLIVLDVENPTDYDTLYTEMDKSLEGA